MKKRLLLLPFEPLSYQPFYVYSFEVDGICYNINRGTSTCSVTYRKSLRYSGKVVIPASVIYDGKEYSVTSIDCGAFYGCSGLTSVEIPDSVTSIGQSAFSGCSGLTSVVIPNSVTSIGMYAFYGCSSLNEVHISDIDAWCKIKFHHSSSNPLANAHHLFLEGKEVKELIIPTNVSEIGDYVFSGCIRLASVEIPNTVTSSGGAAFSGCIRLTSVSIPNSAGSIGNYAFYGCKALTNLIIEDGATTLDLGYNCHYHGLFYDCPLETLHLGRNLSYKTGLSYGYSPFYGKSSLKELTIGNSVISIGESAFRYCRGLTTVEIPSSVTSIGASAFSGCTALKSLTVNALMPPSVARESFDDTVFASATLIVPEESREEYENDPVWGLFVSKDIAVGIDEIDAMSDGEIEVYDLKGVKIAHDLKGLPKGIYIVRRGSRVSKISI